MEIITFYYILFGVLFILIASFVFLVMRSHRKRKEYEKVMKIGDSVKYYPISQETIKGKIKDINNDKVLLEVELDKNRIYKSDA